MAEKLEIAYRRIDSLKRAAKNARTHSPEQVAQIRASMKEFGWTNPILADPEGEVIAGHGRLLAAEELGIEDVPVIVLAGLTKTQRRALSIADNKLALNAGWDMALLSAELTDLRGIGFDLGLMGFGEDEIASLLVDKTAGLTDPDEAPAAPVNPVSRPGDLWILGRHRLLCGDRQLQSGARRRDHLPDPGQRAVPARLDGPPLRHLQPVHGWPQIRHGRLAWGFYARRAGRRPGPAQLHLPGHVRFEVGRRGPRGDL